MGPIDVPFLLSILNRLRRYKGQFGHACRSQYFSQDQRLADSMWDGASHGVVGMGPSDEGTVTMLVMLDWERPCYLVLSDRHA